MMKFLKKRRNKKRFEEAAARAVESERDTYKPPRPIVGTGVSPQEAEADFHAQKSHYLERRRK